MRGKSNADVKMQCQDNQFGFVVHGLWPQKANAKGKCEQPRNCNTNIAVSDNIIKQNLCMMPSVSLIQNEWQKHGSCAFSTPADYYSTTKKLWDGLQKPDLINLQSTKKDLTVGDIQQAFVKINPKLTAKNISVEMNRSRYLKEIRICYDQNLSYRECEQKGAPAHLGIKVGK
jgi:ribonuclease T2